MESTEALQLLRQIILGEKEVEENVLSNINTSLYFLERIKKLYSHRQKEYWRQKKVQSLIENSLILRISEMSFIQLQFFFRGSSTESSKKIILEEIEKQEVTANNFTEFSNCITGCKAVNKFYFKNVKTLLKKTFLKQKLTGKN